MSEFSDIVVAGGGAAGFLAAITAAEADPSQRVTLLEATAHPLAKVRISGGGRCNVTHACFDPDALVQHYPRGGRELRGPFHRWQPRDTMAWFAARGVELKTEPDGRVFPVSDDSATIVDCLQRAATDAGVIVRTRLGAWMAVVSPGGGARRFDLELSDHTFLGCSRLLLATGGNRGSAGYAIAEALGHAIEPMVPSLFTFHVDDPRLEGLAGVSVPEVEATLPKAGHAQRGALLITHSGLSGPAILRLSAWGARSLAEDDYRADLVLNFVPDWKRDRLERELTGWREAHPKRQLGTGGPIGLPLRLWERLVRSAGLDPAANWSEQSNVRLKGLAAALGTASFPIQGKSLNKEEFVTCGGVRLGEVDFRTMESRVCPGLHLAGEILDIDGVTGGFNFQSAWTTGWLAGQAMARS